MTTSTSLNPTSTSLTNAFTKSLLSLISQGKKYTRYTYARLSSDVAQIGAVNAVKRFLHKEMTDHVADYSMLYLSGKTNLMIESLVLDPRFSALFSAEELAYCRQLFLPAAA